MRRIAIAGARIRHRELALLGWSLAGDQRRALAPFADAELVIAQRALGHDAIVGEHAVDDAVIGPRAPVLPGRDERKPEPGLPLQRRNAVHRTADRIAGQGQLADDIAHAGTAVVPPLIDDR